MIRDPKEPGVLEKDVEAYFRDQVKSKLNAKSYKFRSPQNRGVTDRVVVLPGGDVWFVELKKVGGVLSELQKLHGLELEQLGANWCCLVGKTGVDAWIKARGLDIISALDEELEAEQFGARTMPTRGHCTPPDETDKMKCR